MSTLKVDTILKRTGTGTITVGQSGDTISIPSGATLNSAGTNTLTGINNTPAFFVQKSSAQSISQNSTTKLTFDTEIYDTDNTFASDKFTPGVAGKYVLYLNAMIMNLTAGAYIQVYLYKNGSEYQSVPVALNIHDASSTSDGWASYTISVDANTTDYFEAYVRHNASASKDTGTKNRCFFGGYRILGA